jgi:hypothetical protein
MKTFVVSSLVAACLLVLVAPAFAADVVIQGPRRVAVPYGECVTPTWTVTVDGSPSAGDWNIDTSYQGFSSSFSYTFCSPMLSYQTGATHQLYVQTSSGSASKLISINYMSW